MRAGQRGSLGGHAARTLAAALVALLPTAPARHAGAQEPGVPELSAAPDLAPLLGRPIRRVEVEVVQERWRVRPPPVTAPRAGDRFDPEAARRALRRLGDTGAWAALDLSVETEADGVVLRFRLTPRRLLADLRIEGSAVEPEALRRSLGLARDADVTEASLLALAERTRELHRRLGHPAARVTVDTLETDDPARLVVTLAVEPGVLARVARRTFELRPASAALAREVRGYAVSTGDPLDLDALARADRTLGQELRARGWHGAEVAHRLVPAAEGAELVVTVDAGPRFTARFEGQRVLDADQLLDALELDTTTDRSPRTLADRLRALYQSHGYLDAEVAVEVVVLPGGTEAELRFRIREQRRVRVVERRYGCLSGPRTAAEVGSEIDSFLAELPGATLFGPIDPAVADRLVGAQGMTGSRPLPEIPSPWDVYSPTAYEEAREHLQALFRSEGWLGATVGPLRVLRRRCLPDPSTGECRALGPLPPMSVECRFEPGGEPAELSPVPAEYACRPDPARGIQCEPTVVLDLPIRLGPRTLLHDLDFSGNRAFVERELGTLAALSLGAPLSLPEVERARRRILDRYADEGFAYASVETELDFSPDRTRARLRFVISERERVRVAGVVIRGARSTDEGLIRERLLLRKGEPFRRDLARRSEELIATLGVFSSVTVGLEDPEVPAREKVVLVTVQERLPQYLDVRPGFSTGEGFRVGFEYGHRNLGGGAIPLTLRVQLAYLPPELIFERDVRRKYQELDVGTRLERRNSVTLEFPGAFLGPLFRLGLEGVDVRDNARDFGLVKDAALATMTFRPERRVTVTLGGSLELNTAQIFGSLEKTALTDYVQQNPGRAGAFRVPSGTTFAVAERTGVTYDARDNPVAATRGYLLGASVEHVRADPVGATRGPVSAGEIDVFAPTTSQFLRLGARAAYYFRLNRRGLSLATSLRGGYNHQLLRPCRELAITDQALGNCSQTYPDRLFFLGGIDSLRGYPQDSLVPQDIADRLLDPASGVTLRQVVVRGGDLFVNPRLELRVPLGDTLATALFLDAGNLWVDPTRADPFDLRYAFGSGLRVGTPVGPLVFDYGLNVGRVLDALDPGRSRRRFWEDTGAFHFSIGLF